MEVAVFFAVDFEEDGDVVGEPEWGGSVLELEPFCLTRMAVGSIGGWSEAISISHLSLAFALPSAKC